ncbi:MAG: PD40 domain-containing protein, partial [Phycisphaeraceae bacterium]|nr:PD40 domain-containing protein [Phycisphaeraceae bacterium]
MTHKRLVQSVMACVLCLPLGGCKMLSYSGGWNISKREKKSVEAYHKFLEERDLAIRNASPATIPNQVTIPPAHSFAQTQPTVQRMDTASAPSAAWATGQQSEQVISPVGNTWQQPALSNPAFLPAPDAMPARSLVNYGTQSAMQSESNPNFRTPISRASARPIDIFGSIPNAPMDMSGRGDSDPQNITRVSFANEGGDFDVDLSPDGKNLAFASTRHSKTADIYIKSTSGMAIMQITNDPSHDVTPVFSPDGSKIAFSSDRSGNWDIYIVDIQGGRPVQITVDATQDLSPSFSPDGKSLVYASYGSQSGAWEMVVVDVQNPSLKRFIGFGLFPKWSPVDNKIL